MAGVRPTSRIPGPGRLGPVLAVAALVAAACSSGSSAPPPPAGPPAATEPAQSSAVFEQPPEPSADPAAQDETNGEAHGPADADGAAPAGSAGDEPPDDQDLAVIAPVGLSAGMEADLRALLDELAGIAVAWNPAGRSAIAVVTSDGNLYGRNENRRHASASAVKPLWAAAAIDGTGVAAVAPLAHEALVRSNNFVAGEIIDLVGIDAVNTWTREVAGLTDTHLAAWRFGADRVAQSTFDSGSRTNVTTASDLARFYARLWRGELLPLGSSVALLDWLETTPRDGTAGALPARLPRAVSAESIHKAGWLPPYCCPAEVRLIIDAGIVPLPEGDWFAVAAVSDRGEAYNLSVDWVALAACRVYVLLAGDTSHACERSGDGTPRPELWPPPPEPEETDDAEDDGDAEEPAEEPADDAEAPADDAENGGDAEDAEDADRPAPEDEPNSDGREESPPGGESVPETEEPSAGPADAETTDVSESPPGGDSNG